jgi:integrase
VLREKAAIGDGDDPSGERQKKRRENTVAEVADRYLAEHVAAHNKASTAAEARRIVATCIKPALGSIKITDLTRADIKAWHQTCRSPGSRDPLRDAKAGARTVHLGAAAVAFLDAIEDKSGHVVHGVDPARPLPFSTAQHAWARLRQWAGLPDSRLHDRHSVGTFAALAGANAFVVRGLLGHRTLAMTGRYVERAEDMVRAHRRHRVEPRCCSAQRQRSRTGSDPQHHQTAVVLLRRG